MRLLLDTHILLAVIENRTDTFAPGIRRLIGESAGEFHVSVASLWEIAIKWRLGKLQLTPGLKTLPELLVGLGIGHNSDLSAVLRKRRIIWANEAGDGRSPSRD